MEWEPASSLCSHALDLPVLTSHTLQGDVKAGQTGWWAASSWELWGVHRANKPLPVIGHLCPRFYRKHTDVCLGFSC